MDRTEAIQRLVDSMDWLALEYGESTSRAVEEGITALVVLGVPREEIQEAINAPRNY